MHLQYAYSIVVVCVAIACGTSAVNWYCVVVLWYCGIVVLWYCGIVVLWYCGIVVLWYCGIVVLWYLWYLWYCGIGCLRLRCVCGASAVRLRCARGTPAVRLWCGGFLQRDSCRLVAVKIGVAVVVCSVIAADWLW